MYELKSQVTSLNPRVTSWNPRVSSSNPQVTSSNPRFQESLNQWKFTKTALKIPSFLRSYVYSAIREVTCTFSFWWLFIDFIFYLFNFSNKNIQSKVYHESSFTIKRNC